MVITEATSDIEKRYQQEVLASCRALINNRYPFPNDGKLSEVSLADFGKVFAYDGYYDKFFTQNVEKQVDTSQRPWRWREGGVNPSGQMLETFEQAQLVREMFFTKGSATPALTFSLTLTNLDPTANRFILQIDGQYRELRRGPPTRTNVDWPGKVGEAVASFETRYLPERVENFGGPWALFRLIDKAGRPADAQMRVVLDIKNQYNKVEAVIEGAAARANPFGSKTWRGFTCGS